MTQDIQINNAANKVLSTILSSKTLQHLSSSRKMVDNFANLFEDHELLYSELDLIKSNYRDKFKELSNPVCPRCKGTGIELYQEVTPMTNYRWVPWSKRPCTNCNN